MTESGSSLPKKRLPNPQPLNAPSVKTLDESVSDAPEFAAPDLHGAIQRARQSPGGLQSGDVLALQRAVGNQAAIQLLAGTGQIQRAPRTPGVIQRNPGGSGANSRGSPAPAILPRADKYDRNATVVAPKWDRNVSIRVVVVSGTAQQPVFKPNVKQKVGSKIHGGTKIKATPILDPTMQWRLVFHPTNDQAGFIRVGKLKFDQGLQEYVEGFTSAPDKAPAPQKTGKIKEGISFGGKMTEAIAAGTKQATAPVSAGIGALMDTTYQKEDKGNEGAILSDQWGVTKPGERDEEGELEAELTTLGKGLSATGTAINAGTTGLGAMVGLVTFVKEVQQIHQAGKTGDWETLIRQTTKTSLDTGLGGAADLGAGIASGIKGVSSLAGNKDLADSAGEGAAVLGSIASGLRTIVATIKLFCDIHSTRKKVSRGEADWEDAAKLGTDSLSVLKSLLSTTASVLNTAKVFVGAASAAGSILGPVAAAITIVASTISILIELIETARRCYHIEMTRRAANKIRKDASYQALRQALPDFERAAGIDSPETNPKYFYLLDDYITRRQAMLQGEIADQDRLSQQSQQNNTLTQAEQNRLKATSHLQGFSSMSEDDRLAEIATLKGQRDEFEERQGLESRRQQNLQYMRQNKPARASAGGQVSGSQAQAAVQQAVAAQQSLNPQTLPNLDQDEDAESKTPPVTFTAADIKRLKTLQTRNVQFGNDESRRLGALEEYQALGKLREFLTLRELIVANKKRRNRQIGPLIVKFTNMGADVLSIAGAITSFILTVTGSAAYGAGAAAGMGVSLATGVTSAGIKLGGAGGLTGAKGWRWLKQKGRDKEWAGFNKEKSSKLKEERRFRHAASLLRMAGSLPDYDDNDDEIKDQYMRMETLLAVAGVELNDFYKQNGNIGAQVKMIMTALAKRDADL